MVREAVQSNYCEQQVLLSESEYFHFFHCLLKLHHQKILVKMNKYDGPTAREGSGGCVVLADCSLGFPPQC